MFTPDDIRNLVRAAKEVVDEYQNSESDSSDSGDLVSTRIWDENLEALKLAVESFSDTKL
jgi:hypothetical protein